MNNAFQPEKDINMFAPISLINFIEVAGVCFHHPTCIPSMRSVSLDSQKISSALMAERVFTLVVDIGITYLGRNYLAEQLNTLVTCQGQVFIKPLSPIQNKSFWKAIAAIPLSSDTMSYRLAFRPATLSQGQYSLQLLLLTSGVSALPVLFEMPLLEVFNPSSEDKIG
ncbi:MAG: hypothetical protein AAF827_04415 [Cyanobacteria bacterium P01_D01_bin.6]